MTCLRNFVPNLDVSTALRLELEVDEEMVWLVGTVCQAIWKLRIDKSRIQLYEVRSQLEAKIKFRRETRYSNAATLLDQLVVDYFQ